MALKARPAKANRCRLELRVAAIIAALIVGGGFVGGCIAAFEKGIASKSELEGKSRESSGLGLLQPTDTWFELLPEFEKCEHLQIGPLRYAHGRTTDVAISDASLVNVARMGSLKYIHLDSATSITTAGWRSLAKSPRLETISIDSCTQITDVDIEELARTENLKEIYLKGLPRVTDAGIRKLSSASKLICIILSNMPLLTSDGLSWLEQRRPPLMLQVRNCPNLPDRKGWVGKDK